MHVLPECNLSEMSEQPDNASFIEAMVKEVENHSSRGHWYVIPKSKMKDGI